MSTQSEITSILFETDFLRVVTHKLISTNNDRIRANLCERVSNIRVACLIATTRLFTSQRPHLVATSINADNATTDFRRNKYT